MESLAAATAFAQEPFQKATQQLIDYYTTLRSCITAKLTSTLTYLRDQRDRAATQHKAIEEELQQATADAAAVNDHLTGARTEYAALNADLKQVVYAVRQAQLEDPEDDRKRHQELVAEYTQTTLDRFRTEAQLRNAYKETLLESATKEWERNKPEYLRRADDLTDEKTRIEEHLLIVERHITGLRKLGITRNVSGFLFWNGSLTVAAAGSLLAEFIGKHDKSESTFDQLITNLRLLLLGGQQSPTFGTVAKGLFFALLLLATILGTAVLLTWAIERITRSPDRKRRRGKVKGTANNAGEYQAWLSLLSLVRRDLPIAVENITFRTLLQNLPGLLLVPLIICLFVALTPAHARFQSTNTSVAIAFILSFHALSILCATLILGPRLKRLLDQLDDPSVPKPAAAARLTLTASASLGVLSVLLLGLAPTTTNTIGWPLTPLLLFLLMGGFALPFSIIFRGLFKDHDFLQGRREFFRKQIADLRAQPTLDDVEVDDVELDETVKGWRSRTARLDHQHYLEACRRYYDDCGSNGPLSDIWRDDATPQGTSNSWYLDSIASHRLERPEPLLYYHRIPERLVERFTTAYAKRSGSTERITQLAEERARLTADIDRLRARRESLLGSMQSYDGKIAAAEQELQAELLAIEANAFGDRIFLEEAWAIAERGARDLTSPPTQAQAAAA
jgi:hypothetical protein